MNFKFFEKFSKICDAFFAHSSHEFEGSSKYWNNRYKKGGCSGKGSYGKYAQFKSEIINNFVAENTVKTVIEFGVGDGNQLKYSTYNNYIGFDVSEEVVEYCKELFSGDSSKKFKLINQYSGEKADISLSLDVIYHLVEDEIFFHYMNILFDSSCRFVVIYSSNQNKQSLFQMSHVRHRKFTEFIDLHKEEWSLIKIVKNKYSSKFFNFSGSFSDFYFYEKK